MFGQKKKRMSDLEGLEKSIQFATWKISSRVAENYKVKFSKEFLGTLGHLAFEQIGLLSEDLEWFAKHAKRTVINCEDVKLLVRRIPNLSEHVDELCQKNSRSKKKDTKRKRTDTAVEDLKDANDATTFKARNVKKKKHVSVDESSNG